jgi:hypothetical protein
MGRNFKYTLILIAFLTALAVVVVYLKYFFL